jgi:hypothetical protein
MDKMALVAHANFNSSNSTKPCQQYQWRIEGMSSSRPWNSHQLDAAS